MSMNIKRREIAVKEITNGYVDNSINKDVEDDSVRGFGGRLDIRPPYQRELVYDEKQQQAVIDSIFNGYPLNVMYWADKGNHTFEIIDGQQRTISIGNYVAGDFSVKIDGNELNYHNLTSDQSERIDNYKLTIYTCEGNESEKLAWFKIINIAGK